MTPAEASGSAADLIPERPRLEELPSTASRCRACPLWESATQVVFGEGASGARVMLVGEQPGDREDREGRPFVGPAGGLLSRCLERAGIDRSETYVTNVVKHFKFEPRGKRRIHQKPNRTEIVACRPWLDVEIELVKPEAIVCLGATAGQALLGGGFRVTRERGQWRRSDLAPLVMGTVHPSSILRAPDDATRREETERLVEELRGVAGFLRKERSA